MNCWYFYITGSVIKKKSLHPLNTVSFIKHAVVLYMYYSKKILVHDKYSEAKKKTPFFTGVFFFFMSSFSKWLISSLAFIKEHLCMSVQRNNLTNLNQCYDNHPLIIFWFREMHAPRCPAFSCLSQWAGEREREREIVEEGGGVGVGGVSQWDAETQQMLWDRLQNKRGRGNALVVWLEQPWGSAARRLN